jgi:HlyD family secretion protein
MTVPIQSVTTRLPKGAREAQAKAPPKEEEGGAGGYREGSDRPGAPKKPDDAPKPIEVVFLYEGEQVKMVPVKRGISDDSYSEITEGVSEGQQVVSGGYKAISRDLEDGKKVKKGKVESAKAKDAK